MSKIVQGFTFQEILESCEYRTLSYSGRSMYGSSCLGVDLKQGQSPLVLFAEALEVCSKEEVSLVEEALRKVQTDSMGQGSIVYFPGIDYVKSDEMSEKE